MPTNLVKPGEESLWEKAKDKAKEQGQAENWALINFIFQKMKGGKVARVAERFLVKAGAVTTGWDEVSGLVGQKVVKMFPPFLDPDCGTTLTFEDGSEAFIHTDACRGLTDEQRANVALAKDEYFALRKEVEGKTASFVNDPKVVGSLVGATVVSVDALVPNIKVLAFDNGVAVGAHFDWVPETGNDQSVTASHGLPPKDLAQTILRGSELGLKLRDTPTIAAQQAGMGREHLAELKAALPAFDTFIDTPTRRVPTKVLQGLAAAEDLAFRVGVLAGSVSGKKTAAFGEAWEAGYAQGTRFTHNPTQIAGRAKIIKNLADDVAQMLPKIKEFAEDPDTKLPFFMRHFLQTMRDLERELGLVGGIVGFKLASGKTAADLEDSWKRGLANGRSQQTSDELGYKQKVALRALDRVETTLRHFRGLVADPLPAKKWPGVKNFFTDFEELIYTLGALAGTAELGKTASLDDENVTMGTYGLTKLLATLESLQRFYWTAHWTAKGDPQYGDHLLFQRLYESLGGEIDDLAEKIVAQHGEQAVDVVARAELSAHRLRMWQSLPGGPVEKALAVEADLQSSIDAVIEAGNAEGWMPTGLQNFLEGLADAHETAQYLLGQRNKIASKVATRWEKKTGRGGK